MKNASGIRPISIPPVDAPGQLDQRVLRTWAVGLGIEAGAEVARRVGADMGGIRCSSGIVCDVHQWQHDPDTAWIIVHWGRVVGAIAIPAHLATSVVTHALGYDQVSPRPMTGLDWQVLFACLMPVATWLQERAGWDARPRMAQASVLPKDDLGGGPMALLSLSMRMHQIDGTWQLAVPWEQLRQPVRNSGAVSAKRARMIPLAVLQDVPIRVDAVIAGGMLPLTEATDLNVGDLVTLDRKVSGSVQLEVAGQCIGEGRLGSRVAKWALRLTRIDCSEAQANARGRKL